MGRSLESPFIIGALSPIPSLPTVSFLTVSRKKFPLTSLGFGRVGLGRVVFGKVREPRGFNVQGETSSSLMRTKGRLF